MLVSTSELSDGSMPRLCILRIGGMPWRMFISIGNAIETCAPACPSPCSRPMSDIPVMWMNRLSDPSRCVAGRRAGGKIVEDRADAERRQDVRRDLKSELAPDRPCLGVGRLAEIDLAAHDHGGRADRSRRTSCCLMRDASVGYWLPATSPALSK